MALKNRGLTQANGRRAASIPGAAGRPLGPFGRPLTGALGLVCNWRWVDENIALSAQGLRWPVRILLKAHGVRAVLNLRGANASKSWYRAERSDCAALGIAHHNVKMSSRRLPDRETLLALVDAFDALEQPILVKCAGGVDRSAFAASLYRIHRGGLGGLELARANLQRARLRHLYSPEQRWVRAFPDYFEASRGRRTLRDWIADVYVREGFEAYLRGRGMAGSWRPHARPSAGVLLEPAE